MTTSPPAPWSVLVLRVCAAIIDRVGILVLVALPLLIVGPWAALVDALCGVAYFTVFEGTAGAASPGKWLMGLRVAQPSGAPPGLARAAARAVMAWALPVGAIDLLLVRVEPPWLFALAILPALTFVAARRRNGFQTWHDHWTDTRVVPDPAVDRSPLGRVAAWLNLAIAFIMAGALPDGHVPTLALLATVGALSCLVSLGSRQARPIFISLSALVATLVALAAMRPHHVGGGNEASAIGSLRAINSAQATYSPSCASNGYAIDLADLVKPPAEATQGFIAPDLNRNGVVRSGYIITLAKDASRDVVDVGSPATTCNGSNGQPASGYYASAAPVTPGQTGTRYFATDTRGTIFYSTKGPIPNPIPPDAAILQ